MTNSIRRRVTIIILGTAFAMFMIALLFTIPIIRWPLNLLYHRLWYVGLVTFVFIIIGVTIIMKRLRPIEDFRKLVAAGEPIDRNVLDRAEHISLIYPLSSAIIASGIFIVGGFILMMDMRIKFHASFNQLALTLLTVISICIFLAIFCFYLVKRAMEPVVERLMFEDPDFLNITPPFRLGIRTKLIVTFLSLGVLMALFALLGNTFITDGVKESVRDAGAVSHILSSIHRVLIWELVASLITAVVIGILAAGDLSRPLRHISQSAEDMSRGKGRQRIPIITEDEVGELASSINRMSFVLIENSVKSLEKAETLLGALKKAVDSLRNHSWELASIASQQADGATQQSVSAHEASSTTLEISESSRQIAAGARRVHELAVAAQETCEAGNKALKSTLEDIRMAREHATDATHVIEQMGERSLEIQAVVDIIEEISSQINLLSINAMLEAIGAGAAGKRFKTVAEEVGRLADKTAKSIERIRSMFAETMQYTNNAVEVVRKSSDVAIAGAEKAAALEENFEQISRSVEGTVSAAKEIELTTTQQATASDQMVEVISGIAESARDLEEGARRLNKNIENLAMLTDQLREMTGGNGQSGA